MLMTMVAEWRLMRGAGPTAVLGLLARCEMDGGALIKAIESLETHEEKADSILPIGEGTLYPLLYNLEAKGLVRGAWKESTDTANSEHRKVYTLTDKGKKRLAKGKRKLAVHVRASGSSDDKEPVKKESDAASNADSASDSASDSDSVSACVGFGNGFSEVVA